MFYLQLENPDDVTYCFLGSARFVGQDVSAAPQYLMMILLLYSICDLLIGHVVILTMFRLILQP